MIYTTGAHRTQHRHALSGALAIAHLAGWQFVHRPELLPPQLADAFYDPEAEVLLIAWAEGEAFGAVVEALRDIRMTAVIVMPGRTVRGDSTLYVSLARCSRGQVHWHHGLRVWVNAQDRAWLVPDPDGDDLDGPCFRLTREPLQPAGRPWSHPHMHGFGFGNADMQLSQLMARR